MNPFDFFSQPVNAELAILLVNAPLPEDEKQDWLKTLPLMNDEEKVELRDNLRSQVTVMSTMKTMSLEKLARKVKEIIARPPL